MAPLCDRRLFPLHPLYGTDVMDAETQALLREGVQRGRLVLVDPIPTSYWGGFIFGDEVTMHWEEKCDCGWGGPRTAKKVRRFTESGRRRRQDHLRRVAQAYNEFMEFVSGKS